MDPEGESEESTMGATGTAGAGLNREQREAVEHSGGPMAVLAGPGTGKTRVITHRIARLVHEDGVDPARIVALTFTVKAADELRSRLGGLIGFERAAMVRASTFHGLGLGIIRRFSDVIGLGRTRGEGAGGQGGIEIIDSAQARRLLRGIVRDLDAFPESRGEGIESVLVRCQAWFAAFGDHALFPDQIAARIDQILRALDLGQDGFGRTIDADAIAAERERALTVREAGRVYGAYRLACKRAGMLAFNDLVLRPIELLRGSARVRTLLQDEWRHFVVDEFQDVNPAMIELLRWLAPPERAPDLCVVGDDDQSIYAFRGADDLAFSHFASIWATSSPRVVRLTQNYRSGERIVRVASAVIARATTRFAPDKTLVASRESGVGADGGVVCVRIHDDAQEATGIVEMIKASRARDQAAGTQRAWSTSAVIVRNQSTILDIAGALELEGIPVRAQVTEGASSDEGVQDVLAWARLIVDPDASMSAIRLLRRPPFALSVERVRQVNSAYRAQRSREELGEVSGANGNGAGVFMLWAARASVDDPDLAPLVALHTELSAFAMEQGAARALTRIVERTDPIHSQLLAPRERSARLSAIVRLLNFARSRQRRLDPPGDLRAFLEYLDDLDETERDRLPGEPVDRVDSDEAEGSERPDGVCVITAHSAKGLEFDTVYVPRVTPGRGYPPSARSVEREGPIGLFSNDPSEPDAASRAQAEERRVFYVACTRAERCLVLLGKPPKSKTKTLNYFLEIVNDPALRGAIQEVDGEELVQSQGHSVEAAAQLAHLANAGERVRAPRERALLRARDAARARLGDAMANVERAPVRLEDVLAAQRRASEAIAELALVHHLGASEHPPEWVLSSSGEGALGPTARALCARLASIQDNIDQQNTDAARGEASGGAASGTLRLSYSSISEYRRCPACYYTQYVLGLHSDSDDGAVLGLVAHAALCDFYKEFREADAGEGQTPGLAKLLSLGRAKFFESWPGERPVERDALAQLNAQLTLTFERLHSADAHVLELEKPVEVPFEGHFVSTRLDRIDQITLADGSPGFRIIDYKTGAPTKGKREPARDDLQLNIYLMALMHLYPAEGGERPGGEAEYWLLSTGERGRIGFADLKLDKVMGQIREVIEGVLAGRFERADDCSGVCSVLAGRASRPTQPQERNPVGRE